MEARHWFAVTPLSLNVCFCSGPGLSGVSISIHIHPILKFLLSLPKGILYHLSRKCVSLFFKFGFSHIV